MANHIVIIDGVRTIMTDAEFEAHFGHTPTTPRAGEKTYGGRYENASWVSGSINDNGLVTQASIKNSGDNIFSISGSV